MCVFSVDVKWNASKAKWEELQYKTKTQTQAYKQRAKHEKRLITGYFSFRLLLDSYIGLFNTFLFLTCLIASNWLCSFSHICQTSPVPPSLSPSVFHVRKMLIHVTFSLIFFRTDSMFCFTHLHFPFRLFCWIAFFCSHLGREVERCSFTFRSVPNPFGCRCIQCVYMTSFMPWQECTQTHNTLWHKIYQFVV